MPRLGGTTITREQFLLREMRVACQLRESGLADAEVVDRISRENLIQYPTERMVRNIASVCVRRMNAVESAAIVGVIANGMHPANAQANLYAMMCAYPIVRHFMLHEVGPRYAQLNYQLSRADVSAYLTRLQAEYDDVASWSDATLVKTCQVLRRCLVECDMLASASSETLVPVTLDADVRSAIVAKGDYEALDAFGEGGKL